MNWDSLLFNIAVFIAGLVLLEIGADKFVDHTAIVAKRVGVPQTLIALLTAGAEWEEVRPTYPLPPCLDTLTNTFDFIRRPYS